MSSLIFISAGAAEVKLAKSASKRSAENLYISFILWPYTGLQKNLHFT